MQTKDFTELRLCFIKAFISIFALFALNTEILSLINAINAQNITNIWIVENFCFFSLILFQNRNNKIRLWQQLRKNILQLIIEKLLPYKAFVVLLGALYTAIFIVAVGSVPNTADSLTYHMARVANWIQWQNVNFYPTSTLRQLYSSPLAEYGILNIFLLSGNDHFVNLLQFGCLIGCGITVSLIVREFKQSGDVQIFAMLLTATIPMAILQASSTKNDLVVSFFALNFFLFYLRLSESAGRNDLIFCGLTLGFAFLTKGTAYIYCGSIAVIIFASVFFNRPPKQNLSRFFAQSLLILLLAVSINSIHYTRTYQLFGSPLATGEESLVNQHITPKMIAANVVRNYLIHLGTPSEEMLIQINSAAAYLLGNELNNPNSNLLDIPFRVSYSDDEVDAGNFFQIILLTISLFLIFSFRNKNRKNVLVAAFTLVFGFILFSGLLKWNPWLSRLHLPFFMLGCAIIVTVLNKYGENVKNLIILLCLWSIVNTLILGQPRSFLKLIDNFSHNIPRNEQYFTNKAEVKDVYLEAIALIKENNPDEVGLMMENDPRKYNSGDLEYPVWILLKEDFTNGPLIRHIGIKNISNKLITEAQIPVWIISTGNENTFGGVEYDEVWSKEPLRVLKKRF